MGIPDTSFCLGQMSSLFYSCQIPQVIGRIFYVVDRNWNGRLSAAEIRKSNLLQTLRQLEEEADINQVCVCVCVECSGSLSTS